MDARPLILAGLMGLSWIAQAMPAALAPPSEPDPFLLPPEARAFAVKATEGCPSTPARLQALLHAIFAPREEGGMGLVYDNDRTRTVAEVWRDGRANCLSLTAFYVMAVRGLGIRDQFAEAVNTTHWRKVGDIVHYERHVVAVTPTPPINDLVADFMPELHRRFKLYEVAVLPEARFRALFYSNRAVEALSGGDLDAAAGQAQLSLASDPKCSVGWNILGVVTAAMGEASRAEACYRRALGLDGKDGAAIGNLEALLREEGRYEEAIKYRVLGEAVRKRDPFFNASLAEEALQRGDLPEAAGRIRRALEILPREPDFHLLEARVKLASGDPDGARKGLEEARRWSDPADRERYDGKLAAIQAMQAASPGAGSPRNR